MKLPVDLSRLSREELAQLLVETHRAFHALDRREAKVIDILKTPAWRAVRAELLKKWTA